jgi:hypothetical protein
MQVIRITVSAILLCCRYPEPNESICEVEVIMVTGLCDGYALYHSLVDGYHHFSGSSCLRLQGVDE